MIGKLSIAVHAFPMLMLILLSVDEILLLKYVTSRLISDFSLFVLLQSSRQSLFTLNKGQGFITLINLGSIRDNAFFPEII